MKNALAVAVISAALASTAFAEAKGLEIRIVDDKISIQAEAVPLARLLRLLDAATGMTSKVPPELANRNVSVRFSNLSFDDAVKKIFEGQPLDYAVIQRSGIIVTGASLTLSADSGAAPYSPPPVQDNVFVEDNPPFVPPQPMNNQNQPAMIQTPFGAIPNPRAQQGQQQNGVPMVTPGQGGAPSNPFNSTVPGLNGLPGMQTNPFGTSPTQQNYPGTAPGTSPFPSNPSPGPGGLPSSGLPRNP